MVLHASVGAGGAFPGRIQGFVEPIIVNCRLPARVVSV